MDNDAFQVDQLTKRERRFERLDKEESSILANHLKAVKLIENNWEKFCEKNTKAVQTYSRLVNLKKKDPGYQFNVNETGTWTLVGTKLQEK